MTEVATKETELSVVMSAFSMQEKEKLKQYGKNITGLVREAEVSLNRSRVNVGHELINARAVITNDKSFGIWARWNTPFDSGSVWNPLMHIAQAELDGILTDEMLHNSNPAVLAKVIRLPDESRDEILKKIAAGEKVKRDEVPSVKEATSGSSGESDSTPAEVTGHEGEVIQTLDDDAINALKRPEKKTAIDVVKEQAADWQEIINMSFGERFMMMKQLVGVAEQVELALALLGLDNDPQILPNAQTLDFIEQMLLAEETDGKGEEMQVKNAVKVINDARADW